MPVVCLLFAVGSAFAQHRVDPASMYARVYAIVPMMAPAPGTIPGALYFAPVPQQMTPGSRTGIIAFNHVESDDGNFALIEIVAATRPQLALVTAQMNTQLATAQAFNCSTAAPPQPPPSKPPFNPEKEFRHYQVPGGGPVRSTRTFFIWSAIFAAACSALFATYTYYFTDTLTTINTATGPRTEHLPLVPAA